MEPILFEPIGMIHTPFKNPKGTPIQPPAGKTAEGEVEIFPPYREGLLDLHGFSHIMLFFFCHKAGACTMRVKPFLDKQEHGLFATRAPARPNPIGFSIVRLLRVENERLKITEIDIVDQSPLLDIKPYVPAFDARENVRSGWLSEPSQSYDHVKDDGRFQ